MTENQDTKNSERRRFARVNLSQDFGETKALLGANIRWENGQTSEVFDLSYQGAAVARPTEFGGKLKDLVNCHLVLGPSRHLKIGARLAWLSAQRVGLQFDNLSLNDRGWLDEFLEDRLIGAHMRRIDPKYFASSVDFQEWYHGPKGTNLYLWRDGMRQGGGFSSAVVEFEESLFRFEAGRFYHETGAGQTPVRDFSLVRRFVELLSQVPGPEAAFQGLIQAMLQALR